MRLSSVGQSRCIFCDVEQLTQKCETADGCEHVLKQLLPCTPESRTLAVDTRIPEARREEFRDRLAQPGMERRRGRPVKRQRVAEVAEDDIKQRWVRCLEVRQRFGFWSEAELKKYRAKVLDDRNRARNRFQQPAVRVQRGEHISNDTSLPKARCSPLAQKFERWCEYASWAMCEQCKILQPRQLSQSTLDKDHSPYIPASQCKTCSAKRVYSPLKPDDLPEQLVALNTEALAALALLEVDVGPYARARDYGRDTGFRRKTTMIRFRWHGRSVRDRINAIRDRGQRAAATTALTFLRESDESKYEEFFQEHIDFLAKHPGADERTRTRRLEFIERVGLELAMWPQAFLEPGPMLLL